MESSSLPKCFEASVTIVVGGMDIDIELLMKLRKFIGEECMAGLYFVERDEALTHNVFGNWRATKPTPVELKTKENMPTPRGGRAPQAWYTATYKEQTTYSH
jgi:hypothetical protein